MKRMSTDPTEYVVFDVETNGLKSKQDGACGRKVGLCNA